MNPRPIVAAEELAQLVRCIDSDHPGPSDRPMEVTAAQWFKLLELANIVVGDAVPAAPKRKRSKRGGGR